MPEVSFGYACPACGFSAGVMAIAGGPVDDQPSCPRCGGGMTPSAAAPPAIANFRCSRCGSSVGMMVGAESCPGCGAPIE